MAAYAHDQGMQVYACINNWNNDPSVNGFDPELVQAAILTHKDKLIPQLLVLALEHGYDGINIDLENLAYTPDLEAVRTQYTTFIHELAELLHANNLKLIISVPGKTKDNPNNDWSYPFDLASLGQEADYLQLMTYDQHGPWSEPGPVAGLDWVERCLAYTTARVDASKLLIGLPAYGYDWDLTLAESATNSPATRSFGWKESQTLLSYAEATQQWDESAASPNVTYRKDDHEHIVWYENPQSIQAKMKLVAQYKLTGFAMWSLGQEDESFWQAATSINMP